MTNLIMPIPVLVRLVVHPITEGMAEPELRTHNDGRGSVTKTPTDWYKLGDGWRWGLQARS